MLRTPSTSGSTRPEPLLDEVSDQLRVGLGDQGVPVLLESCPELLEVLDDPVVDDGHGPRAIEVRVRVAVRGRAVGGPARVAHRDRAGRVSLDVERALQLRELPGPLDDGEGSVEHGDARGVVSAVLQPSESFEDDRKGLVGAHVAHDAAHEGNERSSASGSPGNGERNFYAPRCSRTLPAIASA